MGQVIFFNSYKLKKGKDPAAFLLAARALQDGFISKQAGYVSSELAVDGDVWADFTVFETMEDAKNFASAEDSAGLAEAFYSF